MVGKTGEGEHLFFDGLKLLLSATPDFSLSTIPESLLRWGSALLAPVTVDPCIPSKNKCSPSPVIYFIKIKSYWSGRGRLFIGAMHGSTVTGASNAELHRRMGMNMATITNFLSGNKSSFSAPINSLPLPLLSIL